MADEIKIHPVEQYLIDSVRAIRVKLGISAEELSKRVSPSTSLSLIGNIESAKSIATYTDQLLNAIAKVFTEISKEQGGKEYTVIDFYPKKPLSDIPQTKTKLDILRSAGPTAILTAILEFKDFLNQPRSIREITDYCNSFNNKNWKSNNLTSTLEYAVRKGKLKKMELPDGGVLYQKA